MRTRVLLLSAGIALLLLSLTPAVAPVRAGDVRGGDHVVIPADEVIDDDLIVTANILEVDGTVTGDLVAFAGQIVVRGTVEGSAMIAGQTLGVSGRIDGSLYAGGFSLDLVDGATIGRNVYFGGYTMTTAPGSQVGRDVYVAGGQAAHNGSIGGDLNASVTGLEINGQVTGDVTGSTAPAGESVAMPFVPPGAPQIDYLAPGIRVGPEAVIGGQMLAQEAAAQLPPEQRPSYFGLPRWAVDRIGQTIGLLVVALVIVYFTPAFLPGVSDTFYDKPLPSLGWGLLIYVILFPLSIFVGLLLVVLLTVLLGLITFGQLTGWILGLTGGLLTFAFFLFLFFTYIVAWLVAGHIVGCAMLYRLGVRSDSRWVQFVYVLLGVLIFQALRLVPILGFVVAFFVSAVALGALFLYWRRGSRTVPASPQPVSGAAA